MHGHSGDRASYLLTLSYVRQTPAYAGDRRWSEQALDYDFTTRTAIVGRSFRTPEGAIALPSDPNGFPLPACLANSLCNSLVASTPTWATDLFIRDPNSALGWRRFTDSDAYNYATPNYLVTPTQRAQAYLDGNFDFDNLRAYYQAFYTWHDSKQNAAPMPLNPGDYATPDPFFGFIPVQVSADNLYNPFGVDLPFAGRRLVEFGNRTYREKLNTYRLLTGLEGSFGVWHLDLAGNYGRSWGSYLTDGAIRSSRVASAVGPSMLIAGVPRCVAIPGDASSVIPGCVPIDLFDGPGSIDEAQIDYLGFRGSTKVRDSLLSLTANVSGTLFSIPWGGDAKLALGYEFRREHGAEIADEVIAAGDSADFNFPSTRGTQRSHEVRAELSLPLVVDSRTFQRVEIDAAATRAHYDTFGGVSALRIGADVAFKGGLTFHSTMSRSFRAPSLRELFEGASQVADTASDPCAFLFGVPADLVTECIATGVPAFGSFDLSNQKLVSHGGNPIVKPERAHTFRAGLTYKPPYLPGFALSIDYYRIGVTKVVGSLGAATILQLCYPLGGSPDPDACSRIVRDPITGQILRINATMQNDGTLGTSGIDFEMREKLGTAIGEFGILVDGTWSSRFHRTEIVGPTIEGDGNQDLGSLPRLKVNGEGTWRHGAWAARLGGRYISSFKQCANPAEPTTTDGGLCEGGNPYFRKVRSSFIVDAQASFLLPHWSIGQTRVALGVNNVFDRRPPIIYGAAQNSNPMLYDFVGRFGYIRLTQTIH